MHFRWLTRGWFFTEIRARRQSGIHDNAASAHGRTYCVNFHVGGAFPSAASTIFPRYQACLILRVVPSACSYISTTRNALSQTPTAIFVKRSCLISIFQMLISDTVRWLSLLSSARKAGGQARLNKRSGVSGVRVSVSKRVWNLKHT